jgi:hypothetical protein
MHWEAIGAIGEMAGALAVVVTLMFLSKQIRDASKQFALTSSADANTLYSDAFWPIYENTENHRIWIHGRTNPASLNEDDLDIYFHFMTRLFAVFDTVVERFHHGAISQDKMDQYAEFTQQFVHSPGGALWLESGHYRISQAGREMLKLEGY